jgi:hypothetical protein
LDPLLNMLHLVLVLRVKLLRMVHLQQLLLLLLHSRRQRSRSR